MFYQRDIEDDIFLSAKRYKSFRADEKAVDRILYNRENLSLARLVNEECW